MLSMIISQITIGWKDEDAEDELHVSMVIGYLPLPSVLCMMSGLIILELLPVLIVMQTTSL